MCIDKPNNRLDNWPREVGFVVVVWKGIHSSQTRPGLGPRVIFYYPRLLCCPDQMLAVVLPCQHRVSSSKTVRPRAPCGARCMGHAIRTWSAVCSEAPHLQFGEGARPHLCMNEWNHPTPVLKGLSSTHAARGKPIPTGLVPVLGTKTRILEASLQYTAFNLWFVHSEALMPTAARLSERFRAAGKTGLEILVSLGEHLRTHLKNHIKYNQGPEDPR